MRKAGETPPDTQRSDAFHGIKNALPFLLLPLRDVPIPAGDDEQGTCVLLGKKTMQTLLTALFRCCADTYTIRDHLKTLLAQDQLQACHHLLLLLYAACREPVPTPLITIVDREELLNPFFQGVMLALDDWLQTQEALWRREMSYAK